MDLSVDCFAVDSAVDFVVDFSIDFLGRGCCCGFFRGFYSTLVVDVSFAVFRDPVDFLVDLFLTLPWIHSAGLENVAF